MGGASLALLLGRRDEGEPVPPPDAPTPVAPPAADAVAQPPERAEVAVAPEAARAFLAWAAENWSDPARATPEPTCYGPKDPDHGWCEGMVIDGSLVRGVKWRKANPRAVEFESGALPKNLWLSCESFSFETIREWVWQHDRQTASALAHCMIGDGALSGQQFWIKNAPQSTYLRVFSADYLRFDQDFEQALRTQGRTVGK